MGTLRPHRLLRPSANTRMKFKTVDAVRGDRNGNHSLDATCCMVCCKSRNRIFYQDVLMWSCTDAKRVLRSVPGRGGGNINGSIDR